MDAPSMVQRSGDTLIVRSVVSGDTIFLDRNKREELKTEENPKYPNFSNEEKNQYDERYEESEEKNETLPQCKIKRNYSCNSCAFFTQNPRYFLTHLRDIHGEKIVINECNLCLYASRHYQKLVRHMKMVHGSTCGIEENANNRKRHIQKDGRKRKLGAPSKHSVVKNAAIVDSLENIRNQTKFEDSQVEDSLNNLNSKCRLCDFIASNRTQLAEHEEEEHGGSKIFRCEKCTYVTHLKARFSKHVKYHSMPMIKCNTCDFRTPYKWNLDRHMKNHGGFGPFKCAACNFTADIKQSLTVHELNHHVPPVGNATGMNMSKRKNKVGATDIFEDVCSESGDLSDTYNNNNNEDFDDCYIKRQKVDSDDDQPTDLSQKSGSESTSTTAKKTNRPVPNLIPIQSASSSLCFAKNYSLRDIASLFFYDEKNFNAQHSHRLLDAADLSPLSTGSSSIGRRKIENFFDKLKETSVTCLGQNENLNCSCGHVSKCLSEAIIHAKSCTKAHKVEKVSTQSPVNLCANSNSIRCQFCRHRCKSSNDLAAHVLKCSFVPQENYALNEKEATLSVNGTSLKHPMENKVFVWNELPNVENDEQEKNLLFVKEEENVTSPFKGLVVGNDSGKEITNLDNNENSYYGVETAPGYGEVTKKMTPEEEAANSSLKKVYKCPHCSFWASTASRFHVHIVGHLNKKPFECSLCNYRSNWRWDITKHIRLKTIRDPTHKNAKVLMNDETGRRNYTKYNKYITLMKVTEEDGDPKLMKSGAMTPNQEASLAFFNDFSSTISKSNPIDNSDKDSENGNNNNFQKEINLDQTQFSTYQMFTNAVLDATNKSMGIAREKSTGMNFSLPRASDEFISHNVDTKPDGVEKKTTFKCKKCSFKNPNRDLVLLHVKEHYKEVETNQDKTVNAGVDTNVYVNNVLAAMCLPPQQTLTFCQSDKSSTTSTSKTGSLEPFEKLMESSEAATLPSDFSNSKTNTGGIITSFKDHGETDEASSGVVTTSGTGVNGWRGPAPFRCGHCHQVSNWKHVIQRHCRLKHNGNIRIESIDRSSSKNAPIYYTIVPQSVSNVSNVAGSASLNSKHVKSNVVASSIVTKNSLDKIYMQNTNETHTSSDNNNNNADNKNLTVSYQNETKTDSSNYKRSNKISQTHASDENIVENISSNEMQSCFRSSNKCPVNLENEEKSVCLQKNVNVCIPSEVSEASGSNDDLLKNEEGILSLMESECKKSYGKETNSYSLSFCKYCPARFIAEKDLMLHLNAHNTNLPYRCNACTYTSRQESYLAAHSTVHTSDYNEKTEKLLKSFNENPEFLRPGLTQIFISETDTIFIVNEFALSLEDNIENSENETSVSDKGCKIPTMKQCPHCPFETNLLGKLKSHMKDHFCVSMIEKPNKCSFCDFSVMDDDELKSHIKIHFKRYFHREQYVKCYTSYDFLKLIVAQKGDDNNILKEVLYDSNNGASHYIEDIPGTRKILVYFDKGELKTKNMDKNDEDECS